MSHNQDSGRHPNDNRKPNYQQKRGGNPNNSNTNNPVQKNEQRQDSARGSNPSQNQVQYVKKHKAPAQSHQESYDVSHESRPRVISQEQFPVAEESQMSAEDKFNQLFGIVQQPAQVYHPQSVSNQPTTYEQSILRNPARKRLNKDALLRVFYLQSEINISQFASDRLNFLEVFASEAQVPENEVATEQKGEQIQSLKRPPNKQWNQRRQQQEEPEDEQDPEWVDFDPKKESSSFFGRAIVNEKELREKIQKDKERNLQTWNKGRRDDQDHFDKLMNESLGIDKELLNKADELAQTLEQSERNFSDIDLIYAKNASRGKPQPSSVLDDDQLEDLFSNLMQDEDKKRQQKQVVANESKAQTPVQKLPLEQKQQPVPQQPPVAIPQSIIQEVKNLDQEQKKQIHAQQLKQQEKPRFSALQNIQNLFQNRPVVTVEKHRIKMDEIAKLPEEESKGDAFKQLMASINPFSQYIIEEAQQKIQEKENLTDFSKKNWILEDSIFQRQEFDKTHLEKTSAEMFVIYKYFSDPLMKVKSQSYTKNDFAQIKDLYPTLNLLQTSPLNIQLGNAQAPLQPGLPQSLIQAPVFQPQPHPAVAHHNATQDSQHQNQHQQPSHQVQHTGFEEQKQNQERNLQRPPMQFQAPPQYESLEDDYGVEEVQTHGLRGNDLNSMESELKSLLGFTSK